MRCDALINGYTMDFKNEIILKHPVSNVSLVHYQHLCQDFAIWGG